MSVKTFATYFVVLVVTLTAQSSWGAAGNIKGKVTDAATSEPLPGATVQLKGTSLGTATDINGNYAILNVPVGSYTLIVSYIGYKAQNVNIALKADEPLEENIKLEAVAVNILEVVITAQASGQNAAINQQLTSNNIENVVSAARIQELPDANAAESVGRLPGISLMRSGGEATQVVIRGLEPKYNMITIDGVDIPSTGNTTTSSDATTINLNLNNRSTDLSMISSDMLQGIEVSKTASPDKDAAVLGGTVNFDIKEAAADAPPFSLLAQGGYNALSNLYNDYKFVGNVEKRFFNDKFGVLAQVIVEQANRSSDALTVNYYIPDKTVPDQTAINVVDPGYNQTTRQRYDATVVLDYQLPDGRISLVNLGSKEKASTISFTQYNDILGNSQTYYTTSAPNTTNVLSNILHLETRLWTFGLDARVSHAYSENITPNRWSIGFTQYSMNTATLPFSSSPQEIAQYAYNKTDLNNMDINNDNWLQSFSKQRDLAASLDLKREITISDLFSATVKFGGSYKYTTRYFNYATGGGNLYGSIAVPVRQLILQKFPWLTQAPYNLDPSAIQDFPITPFYQSNFKFGNFINGNYSMNSATNVGMLSQIMNLSENYGRNLTAAPSGGSNPFVPDVYGSLAYNYSGNEQRSAEYIMAALNIGSSLTIIPGVRFQGLATSYRANRFYNASAPDPFPGTLPHIDTTITKFHGYWLPDVSLKAEPVSWLSVRAAYTNTLAYPDFYSMIPIIDVFSSSVNWNNVDLKPARSQNYDFQIAVHNNEIGLLSVSPFLKRIDDMIFNQSSYITDPSKYAGLPSYTKGYQISTYVNDSYRVDVYGIECEWQTHFWWLPQPLSALVMNVNYTHIFSGAKYPYTYVKPGVFPTYRPTYVDTSYSDRLIDQPNDVANLSVGYDYKNFSILVSLIYQANIFNATNFYNSLRSDKSKYLRWDISAKQGLPWYEIEVFSDINNLNSETDTYSIRGSGFPNSISDYGLTADLGIRWKL